MAWPSESPSGRPLANPAPLLYTSCHHRFGGDMRTLFGLVGLALIAFGCNKDTGGDSGMSDYDAMTAVFDASCGAGCHTDGSSSGGLDLDAFVAAGNLVDLPAKAIPLGPAWSVGMPTPVRSTPNYLIRHPLKIPCPWATARRPAILRSSRLGLRVRSAGSDHRNQSITPKLSHR
jgi:hypothetical protein